MPYTDAMGNTSGSEDYSGSEDTERKTDTPKTNPDGESKEDDKLKVDQLAESNVLNSYRSVTYNFTFAGLKKGYLTDPKKYRESELDLVILKSGGKGDSKMTVSANMGNSEEVARQSRADFAARDPRRVDIPDEQKATPMRDYGGELITGFNTKSPGRFDMYIENVEIETLMTQSENAGSTLPTQIKFEVIEPYSINGFIEALQIAAISAGYPSYLEASFVLKMEFIGYPDDTDLPTPEQVPKSVRYFPLGLTAIEVDVTEKGTRYRCSAVPYNERAFGEPNVIKKPIQMSGTTVKEILSNLMKNINEQVAISDKDGKSESLGNKHNTYEIKFPSWDDNEGWKATPENEIASTKLGEILKDNALYKMVDPATAEKATAYKKDGQTQPTAEQQAKEPEAVKYTPGKTVIQFAENMNIHEAITSVIRDSEYIRDILKDVKKNIDDYGMIKYFLIKMEVENLDVMDETTHKPFQKFVYVVTPYKVHYTKIPTYGAEQIDDKKLRKLSLRQYNYIYTGDNVDILTFKLNFNTLFFEAIPAAMGNQDVSSAKTGAAPNNGVVTKQTGTPGETVEKQQVPTPPAKVQTTPVQSTGGNAGAPRTDSYASMAKKMHEAIIDSKASMITGDLDILGDPFYLVTGGMGNYNPTPDGRGKTKDGEADHVFGEVLITINFRNPIDIRPLEDGGTMYFEPDLIPFSGVYQVNRVKNSFKDGVFKQKLEILRKPGQILDQKIYPSDPTDNIKVEADPENRVVPDQTRSSNPSQRLDSQSAMELFDRGLPNPGLPGEESNFTNATGGLGGSSMDMLLQSPGRIMKNGMLASGASAIGEALPTDSLSNLRPPNATPIDFSANLRMNTSGLAGLNQTSLGTAALAAVAVGLVSKTIPSSKSLVAFGAALAGPALASALSKQNKGSGIGEGASILVAKPATELTGNNLQYGANINSMSLDSNSISSISGTAKDLGSRAMTAVSGLGTNVAGLVSGIGNKISSSLGTPSDPSAIGARVGIDTASLSGLGSPYQSKVLSQISSYGNNTPENVNLSQAASAGVVLNYIPASKLANLPPTTPYSTAPTPGVDTAYVKEVAAKGGTTALANLYGVSNVKNISSNFIPSDIVNSALSSIPTAQTNPFSNIPGNYNAIDINVASDKFASAKSQIAGITGSIPVPDANLLGSVSAKFGSSSAGTSPLSKLVNGKFNIG